MKPFLSLFFILNAIYHIAGAQPANQVEVITATRYIDALMGSDQNDGKTEATAWKTLERVNQAVFGPGAAILFKAGQDWKGTLAPKGSGSAAHPIRLGRYGEGQRPAIHGTGGLYAVYLFNQQHWEITGLEITNFDAREEGKELEAWERENREKWAASTEPLPKFSEARSRKCAILVEAEDAGPINHLHFSDLEIHGVNGDMSSKHNGGIFLAIKGDRMPTFFNDLLIENCYIHDVDRTGISNISSWEKRTLTENINWTPSRNIIIRNNVFERSGANALIVRVAESPLVEQNLFDHCSIKGSGNANFPFNCDNALFQYNEARFTKYNIGDADAGGFDSDYRCKNTVIQYNYSHDNEYGGILVCCMGGAAGDRFNDGTIVRYNIFENNAHHTIRVSGAVTNTLIHDNFILVSQPVDSSEVLWHKNWRGYSDDTRYERNMICNYAEGTAFNFGKSTNNHFENNLYLGKRIEGRLDAGKTPVPAAQQKASHLMSTIERLRVFWEKKRFPLP
jgi:hypothetical protein